MDDRTDSYWRDFVRSGSVSDYLRYAESAKPRDNTADSTAGAPDTEG